VQVVVLPAHRRLEHLVEAVEPDGRGDQQPPPYRRIGHLGQDDPDPEDRVARCWRAAAAAKRTGPARSAPPFPRRCVAPRPTAGARRARAAERPAPPGHAQCFPEPRERLEHPGPQLQRALQQARVLLDLRQAPTGHPHQAARLGPFGDRGDPGQLLAAPGRVLALCRGPPMGAPRRPRSGRWRVGPARGRPRGARRTSAARRSRCPGAAPRRPRRG
jgi:hypothetical protein